MGCRQKILPIIMGILLLCMCVFWLQLVLVQQGYVPEGWETETVLTAQPIQVEPTALPNVSETMLVSEPQTSVKVPGWSFLPLIGGIILILVYVFIGKRKVDQQNAETIAHRRKAASNRVQAQKVARKRRHRETQQSRRREVAGDVADVMARTQELRRRGVNAPLPNRRSLRNSSPQNLRKRKVLLGSLLSRNEDED